MDKKVKVRLLWAVLFSTAFMIILLAEVEWKQFILIANRMDVMGLIMAFAVFIFGNLVRAFRFMKLDHMNHTLLHWWNINALYNFFTATIPGGAGEASTAFILKRFSNYNFFGALRILLLGRLLDIFALSGLFFIAAVSIENIAMYRDVAISLSITLLILSFIALIPVCERYILRQLQKLPGKFRFIEKLSDILNELIIIAREHRDAGSLVITIIQSLVSMIAGVTILYILLRSLGVDFTPVQCFYCYGVYAVFQIIPVQGIAGIGTQAAWWAISLGAAGYQSSDAIAMGFVLHGIFYILIATIGLSSAFFWIKRDECSCSRA